METGQKYGQKIIMKIRLLKYGLSATADDIREYAIKNDLSLFNAKKKLSDKLPKTKLQVWDEILSQYVDVPIAVESLTIKDLEEL